MIKVPLIVVFIYWPAMSLKNLSVLLILSSCFFIFSEIPIFVFLIGISTLFFSFVKIKKGIFLNFLKISIAVLSFIFIYRKFHNVFTTDFGVSLAFIMASLKTWELDSIDDFFNMFLILIVLESCVLIVNPSVLVFIFSIIKIILYFYFILKIQKYELGLLSFKRLVFLILPSLIFSLLLYFTFPRFTQGFIGINSGDSFLSSTNSNLAFKNLTELQLSDNKVFTVYQFPKDLINPQFLYWRSVVLWDFYKNEWRNSNHRFKLNDQPIINSNDNFLYNIKSENTYLDYVPHFDTSSRVEDYGGVIKYYSDNSFKFYPPHRGVFNYSLKASRSYQASITSNIEKEKALRLIDSPETISKLKKDFFSDLLNKKPSLNEKIVFLNSFFISRNFQYSQNPPTYSSIDQFIREGKLGYCSHFASSYAYLLRVLNIPSRIIIGFQGGEVNEFDQSIIVKERDSHAWVEYLDEKNIWKKIDPTVFVAPERISLGSLKYFNMLQPFIGNNFLKLPKSWFQFSLFTTLDHWINFIETKLSNEVFSFDLNDQKNIFKNKAGIYFVGILITFLVVAYYLAQLKFVKNLGPEEKEYLSFLKKIESAGTKKDFNESATEFKVRAMKNHPELADEINQQVEKYIKFFYR